MRKRPIARWGDTRGSSLLEMIVGMLVLAFGMLALLSGSLMASRTMRSSQDYTVVSVSAQNTLDSLKALGWANLTGQSGSYTLRGHPISWSVQGTNPRKILVVVTRRTSPSLVRDSLATYVAK